MNGRKRHVIVDTRGLTLEAAVHPANVQDRDGAKLAIEKPVGQFLRLGPIWADVGYAGKPVDWVKETAGCGLEIARRRKGDADSRFFPVGGRLSGRRLSWASIAG